MVPGARKPGGPLSCGRGLVRGGAGRVPPAPAAPSAASHLQQDWNYSTGLGGHPMQALSHSILANQLQGEGSQGGQKGGRQRGSEETSLWGSPGLQRHLAQFSTLRDPSEDHVGEVRQRASRASSGAQPCHFYQQLGLETWTGERRGEQRWA